MTISYKKTIWNNGAPPPINEENLNNIENGIENLYNQVSNNYDNLTNHSNRLGVLENKASDAATRLVNLEDSDKVQATRIEELKSVLTDTESGNLIDINELKNDVDSLPPVVDTLASTSSTESLSANQGRVLNEKIEDILNLCLIKNIYDSNQDGVVDNASKLNGQSSDYYAKQSDLLDMSQSISSINERLTDVEINGGGSASGGIYWKTF